MAVLAADPDVVALSPTATRRLVDALREDRLYNNLLIADGASGWPTVPSHVHVYVADVDATYRRALEAGAISVQAPVKKEDADKRGGVKDAGGTTWWIATKVD